MKLLHVAAVYATHFLTSNSFITSQQMQYNSFRYSRISGDEMDGLNHNPTVPNTHGLYKSMVSDIPSCIWNVLISEMCEQPRDDRTASNDEQHWPAVNVIITSLLPGCFFLFLPFLFQQVPLGQCDSCMAQYTHYIKLLSDTAMLRNKHYRHMVTKSLLSSDYVIGTIVQWNFTTMYCGEVPAVSGHHHIMTKSLLWSDIRTT